ncbi:MAG: SAM-dependent methyltransferase [Flammeovirgaceae bacterium]|nr:SAM-dependent methyltransferase [Flammeovirgaceae bacterium]
MKIKILDLGQQPIANNFLQSNEHVDNEYQFHLTVTFDNDTKLVSLGEFVPPDMMFNDSYVYHSSLSSTMRNHFKNAAELLKMEFSPRSILEIGSNDGVFVRHFNKEITVAVEPCGNFANLTNELGYKTYKNFWDKQLAHKIVEEHGKQDLVYSANCMCHIQNLDEAFSSISKVLSREGVFVFEDPSLLKMIERGSYDQIYDEHAHIFSVTALQNLLGVYSLEIFKVEDIQVHGGSSRIFAGPVGTREIDTSVHEHLRKEHEAGLDTLSAYQNFSSRVQQSKKQLVGLLTELKRKGYKIVSYGATSKSTTVFNYCEIGTNLIDYIVDITPSKQGKLSPGMHIPVVSPELGFDQTVDYAFLGAWNYEKEICSKEKQFLEVGRFITHVPYVRILEGEGHG